MAAEKGSDAKASRATEQATVERLRAGLAVYSQSFSEDFWLVYKNTHVVVSCFACHPDHRFTSSDRYKVFLVSLLIAFGFTAIFDFTAKSETCKEVRGAKDNTKEMASCLADHDFEATVANTILFSFWSSMIQLLFDQCANLVVTCACVQSSHKWIKSCAEGCGKIAFFILGLWGLFLLIAGVVVISLMGLDWGLNFLNFVIVRLINFLVFTSVTLLVTFILARRGQMKPAADVLATEAGKKKWEDPAGCCPCMKKTAPCELWNKFHGEDKHFADLPTKPFDYDYELKIAWCVVCCSKTCFKVKAKNPMPEDIQDPEAPPPVLATAQLGSMCNTMGDAGGAAPQQSPEVPSQMQVPTSVDGWQTSDPSQVQMQVPIGGLPHGWQACYDENGNLYYQNPQTQGTQWERPT